MEALYQIKNIASKLPVEQGKNITRTNSYKKVFFSSTLKVLSSEMDLGYRGINREVVIKRCDICTGFNTATGIIVQLPISQSVHCAIAYKEKTTL
jgi:hypothetical protein